MTINREISQFASFVNIDDSTKNIGIATTSTPSIGIGTANPSAKFEVVGNTKLQSLNVTGITTLGVTSTTNLTSQTLTVSGITTVGVLTATSIGIGTTNPTAKLDVRGDVTVSGLTSTGSLTVTGSSVLFKQGIDVTGTATVDALTVLPGPSNLSGQTNLYNSLNVAGVTTLASSGGITTTGGNLYVGSDLYVARNANITGVATVGLGTTSTPPRNSQMSFELTTDTNLVIKVRGTDGLLRSANITLT